MNAHVILNSVALAGVRLMLATSGPLNERANAPEPPSNPVPVTVSVRGAVDAANVAGLIDVITGTGGSGGVGIALPQAVAQSAAAARTRRKRLMRIGRV